MDNNVLDIISRLKAHTSREEHTIRYGLYPHSLSVAQFASRFAEAFRESNMAYLTDLWHYIGKFYLDSPESPQAQEL